MMLLNRQVTYQNTLAGSLQVGFRPPDTGMVTRLMFWLSVIYLAVAIVTTATIWFRWDIILMKRKQPDEPPLPPLTIAATPEVTPQHRNPIETNTCTVLLVRLRPARYG